MTESMTFLVWDDNNFKPGGNIGKIYWFVRFTVSKLVKWRAQNIGVYSEE